MRNSIKVLFLLLVIVSLVGCTKETNLEKRTDSEKQNAAVNDNSDSATFDEDKVYTLSIEAKQEDKKVTIAGNTNLPDGSIIGISMVKDLNNGRVNIVAQDSVKVNNGKLNSVLGPFVKYVESGIYEISATFTPMGQESQTVLNEIGGKKAPKLKGSDVEMTEFGFNILTVESSINWNNVDEKPASNNVLVTEEEENAGVSDADLIKWCQDGCRTMSSTESEYNECFGACLVG